MRPEGPVGSGCDPCGPGGVLSQGSAAQPCCGSSGVRGPGQGCMTGQAKPGPGGSGALSKGSLCLCVDRFRPMISMCTEILVYSSII
jgi:hypothetical protein